MQTKHANTLITFSLIGAIVLLTALFIYIRAQNAPQARAIGKAYIERNEPAIRAYIADWIKSEHFALSDPDGGANAIAATDIEWTYHSLMYLFGDYQLQAEAKFRAPIPMDAAQTGAVTGGLKIIMRIDPDANRVITSRVVIPLARKLLVHYDNAQPFAINAQRDRPQLNLNP